MKLRNIKNGIKSYWPSLKIISLCLSSGCSMSSGHYQVSKEAATKSNMTFVGIPTIFGAGITGSTFPISPTLSLTAKHVARETFNEIVAEHPHCDVAIIQHDNRNAYIPKLENAFLGDPVTMYGHSAISSLPVESSGVVLNNYRIANEWQDQDCVVTSSSAGAVQGMSGGPVYSKDGHVVGVLIAISASRKNNFNTIFVPYMSFSDWIKPYLNK